MKKILLAISILSILCSSIAYAMDSVELVQTTLPSIVFITKCDDNNTPKAFGSGFFVTAKGDILTNAHVVDGGSYFYVHTNKNKNYQAFLKAFDKGQDMALLCIPSPTEQYKPLQFFKGIPPAGTQVFALGAPGGYTNSVSGGYVSQLRRFNKYPFLQTSCATSPGSSGGPVVNESGLVIGMTTFLVSETNDIYFNVPSQQLKVFVERYKSLPIIDSTKRVVQAKEENAQLIANQGKNTPAKRFVFMLKHDEMRDGYIETYLDTHSVKHSGNIITCVLLSKMGKKYAKQLSKNGVLADMQVTTAEINTANRTSRILKSAVLDASANVLLTDDKPTQWTTIMPRTSVEEYLTYILCTNL